MSTTHPLIPYEAQKEDITLTGEIVRQGVSSLVVTFSISDAKGVVIGGPVGEGMRYGGPKLIRAHELWKRTCFELFISPRGSEAYYECNMSTKGEWNIYYFDSYRTPQPPKETEAFSVTSIEYKEGELTVVIHSQDELPSVLDCALTAVIETVSGESFYALSHKGGSPNFHIRESFVLAV